MMDRMDYDEYAFLKQLLDEYDKEPEEPTMEKWIKSLVKAVKQKAAYKNRWQTAVRDLILGR